MAAPTHAPAVPRAAPDPTTPTIDLDLEARLALVDAAMTVRLEQALVQLGIDAAHPETIPDPQGFTVEGLAAYTATVPRPAPDLYPTPVAAVLQRAAGRLETDGWCRGAMRDASGARCLYGAIHREVGGSPGLESAALDILLAAIRREFDPGAETVPSFNDRLGGPRVALRLLDSAARLADARGM
jgi:hypothetical protein